MTFCICLPTLCSHHLTLSLFNKDSPEPHVSPPREVESARIEETTENVDRPIQTPPTSTPEQVCSHQAFLHGFTSVRHVLTLHQICRIQTPLLVRPSQFVLSCSLLIKKRPLLKNKTRYLSSSRLCTFNLSPCSFFLTPSIVRTRPTPVKPTQLNRPTIS